MGVSIGRRSGDRRQDPTTGGTPHYRRRCRRHVDSRARCRGASIGQRRQLRGSAAVPGGLGHGAGAGAPRGLLPPKDLDHQGCRRSVQGVLRRHGTPLRVHTRGLRRVGSVPVPERRVGGEPRRSTARVRCARCACGVDSRRSDNACYTPVRLLTQSAIVTVHRSASAPSNSEARAG